MATHALPDGWTLLAARPREELHQALLTSTCERSFSDVPIDWWDRAAEVWRPTSIVRLLGGVWDVGRDVEVLIPDAGATSPARVSIGHVRLSKLLTAGVSRYWVARYQKLLVLRLVEQAAVLGGDPDPLRRLAGRIRHQEALGHDVWTTAYLMGARDGVEYAPELPLATADNGWEPADAGDPAAVIHAAVRVLAADLMRLDAALEEAGADPTERAAHPLLAAITSLLLRSPATPMVSPAGSDPRLA
ncbi:MAG: hypothetical protein WAN83_09190 [Candidatus Dormiibacterota bacterium]